MTQEAQNQETETENFDFSKVGPVLVVDDDQSFRTIVQDFLKKQGLQVISCESANHALKFIERQSWNWQPWLIITDLVMNGMGGFQLLRRLNEVYPQRNIPFVVISRLNGAEDISEAELAGAAAFLSKPLKKELLLTLMARINGRPREKGQLPFTHNLGTINRAKPQRERKGTSA